MGQVSDQDIRNLDQSIVRLSSDIREDLAERGRRDLFFLCKAVLGFKDLTVGCHGPMCTVIDSTSAQFLLLLMPRDHLKTSVATIGGTIQKVIRNVEERCLVANESATNAERMIRAIRQHAEGNRVFRALYSSIIPKDFHKAKWNDNELVFVRQGYYPEPTIDSIGMTGAVTSRHYTHITYDDPISEEAVKSEKVMEDTINRMSTGLNLLVDPGKNSIMLVGTRWALHDVYSVWEKVFGDRLLKVTRSATEYGKPIWPERFTLETLALKRTLLGEYRYSCLMMNKPRNAELQDLNVDDLKFFQWKDAGTIVVDGESIPINTLDVTTTVDLAGAEKLKDDRNSIVTVGIDRKSRAFVLEAWGARCTPIELITKLISVKRRFMPRAIGIEDIAYQKAFKYFVKQECERLGLYMNIVPLKAQKSSKEFRIRGLQPIMATGHLYIDPSSLILRDEMADFPLGEHDDVLDCLAMQLQLFRGQMSQSRWNKYKESEDRLIKQIMSQGSKPKPGPFDGDADGDEEDKQARITEVLVA